MKINMYKGPLKYRQRKRKITKKEIDQPFWKNKLKCLNLKYKNCYKNNRKTSGSIKAMAESMKKNRNITRYGQSIDLHKLIAITCQKLSQYLMRTSKIYRKRKNSFITAIKWNKKKFSRPQKTNKRFKKKSIKEGNESEWWKNKLQRWNKNEKQMRIIQRKNLSSHY